MNPSAQAGGFLFPSKNSKYLFSLDDISSENSMKSKRKIYIVFYKPYGVLSQFTREAGYFSLADFGPFPQNTYAAGRLDADSEGLLLLTNDNVMKHRLTDPKFEHERTYLVQVEGIPDGDDIERLQHGIIIENRRTKSAKIKILKHEPDVPPRSVPIRYRKNIPTSWLEIVLHEGRNRQVRKMTAAVGHPTLRLVRKSISFLTIDSLKPGFFRELTTDEIENLLDQIRNP
jgi:23S rRNA pseudouridine2457 synthase